MRSTRIFYKHARTPSFVSWHQDGGREQFGDPRIPVVWLGLTEATEEYGCLRVVRGSHRLGPVPHVLEPHDDNLTGGGMTVECPQCPFGDAIDLEMRAGEMSLHHPLTLHGSRPNRSDGPRIGLSATCCTPATRRSLDPVISVHGAPPDAGFEVVDRPPAGTFENAIAAYVQQHGSEAWRVSG